MDTKDIQIKGQQLVKTNRRQFKKLRDRKRIDTEVAGLHDQVFSEIDCLECANCCKTTGPLFTRKDIERISKHMGMTPADFEANYLQVDEDRDHVLQVLPCPFLGTDNYCSIYDVRPKACREYPHTDRRKQKQIWKLHEKNLEVCPAVQQIFMRLLEI